jgi:hypothetical protein
MELWSHFQQNNGRIIHKVHHYFPIYEKYLSGFRNKKVTLIEIGVFKGGSLSMFSEYLGPLATVVGLDINQECKKFESDLVNVRIGDQGDLEFLGRIYNEFGPPDIVIDDGSHHMSHLRKSFEYLYPKLSKNGVYIIEDTGTSYWPEYGGGYLHKESFIEFCKTLIDQVNFEYIREDIPSPEYIKDTSSISFYASAIVFEKGTIYPKKTSMTGNDE